MVYAMMVVSMMGAEPINLNKPDCQPSSSDRDIPKLVPGRPSQLPAQSYTFRFEARGRRGLIKIHPFCMLLQNGRRRAMPSLPYNEKM